MKALESEPFDQCFTHVAHDGTVRHFNTGALIRATVAGIAKPTFCYMALDEHLMEIVQRHGIERDHLERVDVGPRMQPVLVVRLDDDSHVLIDGNHRTMKKWEQGGREILAAIYEPKDWTPCLIEDFPDMTESELVSLGVLGERS